MSTRRLFQTVDTANEKERRANAVLQHQGVPKGYKGIYTLKLPKLDFTTDAEYAANLVNVNMWL